MSDFADIDERNKFEVLQDLPVRDQLAECNMCGRCQVGHVQFRWRRMRGALCPPCVRFVEGLAWHQVRTIGR